MSWLSKFAPVPSQARLRELAHQVATRSQEAVQQQVAGRLADLPLGEARGYVRARSAAVIRREVDLLIADQTRLEGSRRTLHRLASEAAIRQAVWNMLRDRKEHREAAPTRRAA